MTQRLNFATGLASGRLPLNPEPANSMEQMGRTQGSRIDVPSNRVTPLNAKELLATLGNQISPDTRAIIEAGQPPIRAALVLGTPEFMHR
jgi:hypothetical protein